MLHFQEYLGKTFLCLQLNASGSLLESAVAVRYSGRKSGTLGFVYGNKYSRGFRGDKIQT